MLCFAMCSSALLCYALICYALQCLAMRCYAAMSAAVHCFSVLCAVVFVAVLRTELREAIAYVAPLHAARGAAAPTCIDACIVRTLHA